MTLQAILIQLAERRNGREELFHQPRDRGADRRVHRLRRGGGQRSSCDFIDEHADEFAQVDSLNTGMSLMQATLGPPKDEVGLGSALRYAPQGDRRRFC
jgi:hypothetical protein